MANKKISIQSVWRFSCVGESLELWFPIRESRFEDDTSWSLLIPSGNTLYDYDAGLCSCSWYGDVDFSRKNCFTVFLCPRGAGCSRYSRLSIESVTIQSDRVLWFIGIPARIWSSWCHTREIPDSISRDDGVWSRRYSFRSSSITDTVGIVVFHFPAICFITRKSQPVGITNICHCFDPFTSNIDRFYIILCIESIEYPSPESLEQCTDTEREDRQYDHKFDYGCPSRTTEIFMRMCYSQERVGESHSFIMVKSCVERRVSFGP